MPASPPPPTTSPSWSRGLPDFARDVLCLVPLHFLAYYKSLAEGQSPSTPKNLTYWVRTEGLAGAGGPAERVSFRVTRGP